MRAGCSFRESPTRPWERPRRRDAGVAIVLQELNLVETLSVAEQVFFDALPTRLGFIDRAALRARARAALGRVGLQDLEPERPVGSLGVGQRQMLAVAAALARPCRVLILDEPTAALSEHEAERLFAEMERLKAKAQRSSISPTGSRRSAAWPTESRCCATGGRWPRGGAARRRARSSCSSWSGASPRRRQRRAERGAEPGDSIRVLRVRGLRRGPALQATWASTCGGARSWAWPASWVRGGRRRCGRCSAPTAPRRGEIELRGRRLPRPFRSPKEAVGQGLALVTENRKDEGLLLPLSVRANLTLARLPELSRRGFVRAEAEATAAGRLVSRLGVKCASVDQPVGQLSGGNQQKVVLGRWLDRDFDVLLCDEPTRGVDVAARAEIHELLRELGRRGKALLVVSSEIEELRALCDRIVVLRAGRVTATFERESFEPGRDPRGGAAGERRPKRGRVSGGGREYLGLGLALAALVVVFGALTDHFLSRATFAAIASQVPAAILVAVGMTFVLIVGGIDLSVGSVLGLAGAVLGACLGTLGLSLPAGLLATLLAGLLCGALNGGMSVYLGLPSFIVTLGMLEIARGAAYTVSHSQTAYIGARVEWIAEASVLGLSLPTLLALAMAGRSASSSSRGPSSGATWWR